MEDIKGLNVEALAADDSILWLWTTNAHLPLAFEVVNTWGFEYKTHTDVGEEPHGNGRLVARPERTLPVMRQG